MRFLNSFFVRRRRPRPQFVRSHYHMTEQSLAVRLGEYGMQVALEENAARKLLAQNLSGLNLCRPFPSS